MKFLAFSVSVVAVLTASPAVAQPVSVQQTATALEPAPTIKFTQGTEVSLRLLRDLTTKGKALKVGDRFDLELVDPLKIGPVTVVPSGTRAVGEIMSVRNKGMWGKSGKFNARLMHIVVGERNIKLGGTFDDKGVAGGWGAGAVSAIVFLPAGFFMTGTSAKVEAGTIVKGFLDQDVPVSIDEQVANQPLVPNVGASDNSTSARNLL
jgi:hypothetical protein